MIYIHNVQYSQEKIQIAIDIIENLADRIEEIDSEEEHENVISKSLLDEINQEYLSFNKQKDEIILMSKDYQKKLIGQLENLKMNALNKYLSTKYSSHEKRDLHVNIVMCFLLLRRNLYQPTLGLVKNNTILQLIRPYYVLNLIPTHQTWRLLCKSFEYKSPIILYNVRFQL